MGYQTDLEGEFVLDKPLSRNHKAYLERFSETRRMKRDSAIANELFDILRKAVDLPIGIDGEYCVREEENNDESIIDYNKPPRTQPGLFCQWIPNKKGTAIVWDGNEKFYEYIRWIAYIIENFLQPWEYKLNGEVKWSGEEQGDVGFICIKENVITVKKGKITYE